jgi:hypothetical protein
MKKKKEHTDIISNYESIKFKHLERLATKMLVEDEKMNKLKEKNITTNFLDLF